MRRGLAWVAGITGVLTALFLRRRRSRTPVADPAVELRRTLEAARSRVEEAPPEPEQAPEEPVAAPDSAARRREVHEDARAAIDEMRRETGE